MTQIVIDIPTSLGTLIPTMPAIPEWTARQVTDFVGEGMIVWFAAWAIVGVILLIGVLARTAAEPRPIPPTPRQPPRVKSQTFTNWLVHGGVNGVQR